jgi:hypothetical protein
VRRKKRQQHYREGRKGRKEIQMHQSKYGLIAGDFLNCFF